MDELVKWLERQIRDYQQDLDGYSSEETDVAESAYTLGAKEAYEFTIKQILRIKG